jgi:hypothetical protein
MSLRQPIEMRDDFALITKVNAWFLVIALSILAFCELILPLSKDTGTTFYPFTQFVFREGYFIDEHAIVYLCICISYYLISLKLLSAKVRSIVNIAVLTWFIFFMVVFVCPYLPAVGFSRL